MDINFLEMPKSDLDEAFLLYKGALRSIIEDTFGWNEYYQKERFHKKYEPSWFYWIEHGSQRIGYVCFFESESELHISLLIIFECFRNKSYGRSVMQSLHQRALQKSFNIKLSSFKNNAGAVRFYKKIGFEIIGEDDYFFDMFLIVR